MKLHDQYLKLHSQHGSSNQIDVTLDELALTLGCTHRNALHVVNKMVAQDWISWTPSRGRGRRSLLKFLIPPEDIAVQSMMQAISRKDIGSAIAGIKTHAKSSVLQDTLQGWLLAYFGHHAEMNHNRQIDTLRLPITQQLHTFDPLYMNLLAESFVSSHVFDGLVRRGSNRDEIVPNLAHAWETDESRTLWTFFLRKEVPFHHGKVLSSKDVVYSFQRLIQSPQRTLYSSIFKEIQEVTAVNPSTVRIQLKRPNELFLPFLCTSRAAIVPHELVQWGESGFGRKPVGTGPFKVSEMNENLCILEVFPYYFRGRAHLDRVEILNIPWTVEAALSESGSPFHVIQNPTLEGEGTWSRIHSESFIRKFVTCNTQKKGPLSDPVIRANLISCLKNDATLPVHKQLVSIPSIPLQIATISQYQGDAESIAATLAGHGYLCKVVTSSPEDFKGPIRMESDLIVFSLFRDQDEQLRLFDLYRTLSQHIEQHIRADVEGWLNIIARESNSVVRVQSFQRIEDLLIGQNHLHILHEKPIETAYLPSVRGVTFNSQGWVDLRHVWFPPLL
ncbi:ABC transporter substrate-binding protein [Paenibacillus wynnii]|uniref:ABC transporter substrate-binding protein n=1 Tax=Paenibacillus wynnii TaxID=268407 RepID=A0A098M3I2_9BACL|nr:ABC transporter substrate-binding protein [Paenibacillus wynnii]KGE16566.1 ABC transporter substrate-binding protein [Paenibacillus wynnii]